ncbi:MAG TPA: hypothetical protein VJ761_21095 [Ktedonobacteraceae bacterium]|nr:hypothetical protein [Ktedonobacteraceae bacterium]
MQRHLFFRLVSVLLALMIVQLLQLSMSMTIRAAHAQSNNSILTQAESIPTWILCGMSSAPIGTITL